MLSDLRYPTPRNSTSGASNKCPRKLQGGFTISLCLNSFLVNHFHIILHTTVFIVVILQHQSPDAQVEEAADVKWTGLQLQHNKL